MFATASHKRLSSLDATFLEVESPTAHMHVGWVMLFDPTEDGSPPDFEAIKSLVASRLARAPRYRQRLAPVPLGVNDPVWVDDEDFDVTHHVRRTSWRSIDDVVESVFSTPLRRDRPLWELWVADGLADGRTGLVGKVHHCMVDGIAAVELATLFLDPSRDPSRDEVRANGSLGQSWQPAPAPGRLELFTVGLRDRVGEELTLLRLPASLASPRRLRGLARDTGRLARAVAHSLTSPPSAIFNDPTSPRRRLARLETALSDLRRIREAHRTTINDVVLAASAGGVRRYLQVHGDTPVRLRAMVPVNVRESGHEAELGNQVSFMFVELPCDEPDPVRRLEDVHAEMLERKSAGEPGGSAAALAMYGYAPHPVQHAISHALASSRSFNLVVSNVPGPRDPLFLMGNPLREAYPVVPTSERHAVSIGFTTVGERGFFGIYADLDAIPDAELLARGIGESVDELVDRS